MKTSDIDKTKNTLGKFNPVYLYNSFVSPNSCRNVILNLFQHLSTD